MYFKRLRELREDNDLLQKDIAKIINIDQQYYSKYETGKKDLPLRHLLTLCQFYGVSADYILGLSDDINPTKMQKIEIIGRNLKIIEKR